MKYFLLVLGFCLAPLSLQAQSEDNGAYIELQVQGSGGTIRMGETAEVARFRLSNRSGKNITLNRITFRNYGTADLDESFENFVVQNNGATISQAVQVSRNDLTFTFSDVLIDRGDSLVLSVVGRLIYAQSGETVELGIKREEDVLASILGLDYFSLECRDCEGLKGKSKTLRAGGIYLRSTSPYAAYRYYGSARRSSSSSYLRPTTTTSSTSTNTAASVTSRYYYRPAGSQSYSPGSKDIRFFSTYINSKTDSAVEGLFLNIGSGSQASDKNENGVNNELEDFSASFSDFNLYVNNDRVDSTNDFTEYNGQPGLFFNSSFEIPANAQILLTGRITNQAVNGDKVKFALHSSGLIDPVYLYNGASVEPASINGGSSSNYTNTGVEPLSISK